MSSTAARLENKGSFFQRLRSGISLLVPKSLEQSICGAAETLFPESWLNSPDSAILPCDSLPSARKQLSDSHNTFETNYMRFAAEELTKRLDNEAYQRRGVILQMIAAGWHSKNPHQLEILRSSVGKERILVMHGADDKTIALHHAQVLIDELRPASAFIKDRSGHVLQFQDSEWYNEKIKNHVALAELLSIL